MPQRRLTVEERANVSTFPKRKKCPMLAQFEEREEKFLANRMKAAPQDGEIHLIRYHEVIGILNLIQCELEDAGLSPRL